MHILKEMKRLSRLQQHLESSRVGTRIPSSIKSNVYIAPPPNSIKDEIFVSVFTPEAIDFIIDLHNTFAHDLKLLLSSRESQRLLVLDGQSVPRFLETTKPIRQDTTWRIDPLPSLLMDRRVDIGDVSPANDHFLRQAHASGAQGVQVDFDDGHVPTWHNTIIGHYNLKQIVQQDVKNPGSLLIVRPRALNMDECHVIVNGQIVSGALLDFGLHIFHSSKLLVQCNRGPYFYLPKLENYKEAAFWTRVFTFIERKLFIPQHTIKAIILIENLFAALQMDEILYEMRHYSAGLNCGMWDYTASIVSAFSLNEVKGYLPDRQQYVSMKSPFLKQYMELLLATCRRRHAPATTGMIPFIMSENEEWNTTATKKAVAAKQMEVMAGSNGALVYDIRLVKIIQEVFQQQHIQEGLQQLDQRVLKEKVFTTEWENAIESSLFILPHGPITSNSTKANLRVLLLFIAYWLQGYGTVIINGCVEDSATAEISRVQLWHWIHHNMKCSADANDQTTPSHIHIWYVCSLLDEVVSNEKYDIRHNKILSFQDIDHARMIVYQLITMRLPPTFLTTYLLNHLTSN